MENKENKENKELYELTNPQKSIWLTDQMYPNTNINNISGLVIVKDNVNLDLLRNAIYQYVRNTQSLRLQIILSDDTPKQYISQFKTFDIEILESSFDDLTNLSLELTKLNFNIIENSLFMFKFIRLPNNNVAIFTNIHHIISDAWSLSLYASDVIDIYSKMKKNSYLDIESSNFDYIDYYYSEISYLDSNRYKKDEIYWTELFNTLPNRTYIKNNLPKVADTTSKRKIFTLDSNLLSRINDFCNNKSCSLYTFFVSILSIYLSKINETNTISIATPILNRSSSKEKSTFGMFINTLPFIIDIDDSLTFLQFLNHVISLQKTFFRHQKFPYLEIQNILKQKYNVSDNIYDVGLSYQNARHKFHDTNVDFETTWNFNEHTLNSLDIHFYDMNNTGTVNIMYDYQINKLEERDIENIHNRLIYIIEQVLSSDILIIESISILPKNELDFINNVFNNTYNYYPKDSLVHNLIDLSAEKSPNSIALVHGNEKITYTDLKYSSDLIAKNLIKNGVKPNDCVSILFDEKNINLICSMIGILKAGACFLAIYPEYPKDRIAYILENSNTKMLITESKYINMFNVNSVLIDILKKDSDDFVQFPHINANDNCYIIYTSGSTGKPKGIQISHNNLINFVYGLNKNFENTISHLDNFLSVANISFDASIQEIFTPLIYRASLFLYKDLNYTTDIELSNFVINKKITFAFFPPSMLDNIAISLSKNKDKLFLNKLSIGVEPIKASTLSKYISLNPNMKILNGYGPSETTICCSMYLFKDTLKPNEITPIGVPIANSKILLLNKNKNIVPVEEAGEIYVQGDCVGNGYLYNDELNHEVFNFDDRIFKTGDYAKLLNSGELLFIGRKDNQIKYRGYRIDLGEIEKELLNISTIQNVLVYLYATTDFTELFCFVSTNTNSITEIDIRNYLSTKLPHYMIPNNIIILDKFPLTPNGKIDKNFLYIKYKPCKQTSYSPPVTKEQKLLCSIWSKTLGISKIGIDDNFFNLGGDSLSAIKICLLCSKKGYSLSAQDFYKFPTIKLLTSNIINTAESNLNIDYLPTISVNKDNITKLSNSILLLGATGFLGAYILYDLLTKTSSKIYCIVRGHSISHSIARLKNRLNFYFNNKLDNYFFDRIVVLNGDCSKTHLGLDITDYELISNNIGTIINSAALVKHIGNEDEFTQINIDTIKNLINLCIENPKINLTHISTMSIFSSIPYEQMNNYYDESTLYFNQNINSNIYVKTKFDAEQLLAYALKNNNLNISIFRVGNITWSTDDHKFQINTRDNLFYNILSLAKTFSKLPKSLKSLKINVSPVNLCSSLITDILINKNVINMYHIYNFKELTFEEIVRYLNTNNYNIKFINDKLFAKILNKSSMYSTIFSHMTNQLNINNNTLVSPNISNKYTSTILKDIHFNWPVLDYDYFINMEGENNE